MLFNRWQWMLLAAIIVAVGVYRGFFTSGPPSQDLLSAKATEMDHIWLRITPYPGTRHADAREEKVVTATSIIQTRRWQVNAGWDSVRAHFEKALADAAWYRIGETEADSGPVLLYRQDPFHMVVSLSGETLELRATWSADGHPLLE